MGNGFSVTIDTSRLQRRLSKFQTDIKTVLQSEWPIIVQECLANVLQRTPSEASEFAYLMGEDGGVGYDSGGSGRIHTGIESLSGHKESSSPHGRRNFRNIQGDRISFIRSPGMWLRDLVVDPATYRSDPGTFTIGLGVVPALENLSKFSWQNWNHTMGAMLHTSDYGVWSFFEYGQEHLISAAFGNRDYKLKPSDTTKYWAMSKHYPRAAMYSGFNRQVFRDAVAARIAAVKF